MVTYEGNQDQIRRLATYLRHNPSALNADPIAVAQACDVSVDLVRQSLLRSPRVAVQELEPSGPGFWARFADRLTNAFNYFDRRLLATIAISTLITCLVIGIVGPSRQNEMRGQIPTRAIFVISAITLLGVFHLILYFRRGVVLEALKGSLATWISAWSATTFTALVISDRDFGSKLVTALVGGIGLFLLTLFYCGAAAACALMGAYRVVRDEERTLRSRTRQQLIERMFAIEELLGQSVSVEKDESWVRGFLAFGRKNVWWLAAASSATFSLLSEISWKIVNLPGDLSISTFAFIFAFFIVTPLHYVSQVILAFMGGRPVRSIFVSLLYASITVAVGLLPFFRDHSDKTPKLDPIWQFAAYIFIWAVALLIGIFAGIGAQVEERSYRRKRLSLNDPQLLLGELIEIQRVLNPDTSTQFVMVVDAARSSVMKANADPMQAEWSFREYQMFLARIVESNGGRIHSTAGDGAIAMFGSADAAFQAAREIQSRITEFNTNVNRLKDPFRLRIGIHCDTVQADLSDVQFAAVIDIAAHIEGASQVGGIAATQPVVDLLPTHRFAALNEMIDGYVVHMALSPTLDPETYD